jgi:hypothetical protein
VYLLRTAPCTDCPVLPLHDAVLRESLSVTLNVDLDDDRWRLTSLPLMWGGLGVRGIVRLAPAALFASAASTMEVTTALLPTRLHDVKDSDIDTAMSACLRHASCSTTSTTPMPPFSAAQCACDDPCCKINAGAMENGSVSGVGCYLSGHVYHVTHPGKQ